MLALLSFLGRLMLCSLFIGAAFGHINDFNKAIADAINANVPQPQILLYGAIGCLIIGSICVVFGYKARFGAFLLLVFLIGAAYYFHPFWKPDLKPDVFKGHLENALRNIALAGGMVFIIANGAGAGSIDAWLRNRPYAGVNPRV